MVEAGNVVRGVDGTITSITNPAGVQAYKFSQPDNTAFLPTYPARLVQGGIPGFDHSVVMSIMGNTQVEKNSLLSMLHFPVVGVVLGKNGKGTVYGDDQGLKLTATEASINSPLGTTIPLTLATDPDSAPERRPPLDVYDTDDATTSTLIAGLNIVGV